MIALLSRLICLVRGRHDWVPAEMLDYLEPRGTVVVELECACCPATMIGEFDARQFTQPPREGPWSTEHCLLCDKSIIQPQTGLPDMWPNVVMCKPCTQRWMSMK